MQEIHSLIYRVVDRENIIWAWNKAKKYLQMHDVWYYDELEVYKFEANLDNEIKSIQKEILEGSYLLEKIKPIPFPKHQDINSKPQCRQTFWLSVRDQVVWIAFVNITGPFIERLMPSWSYGNRLYRSIWYDDSGDRKVLKIGSFRHSSGFIYKQWHHSYPLYRKHILYTLKRMNKSNYSPEAKDEKETQDFIDQQNISQEFKLKYLTPNYWHKSNKNIFWASVDLEKFYPKINLSLIENVYKSFDASIVGLLGSLLSFYIDFSDWDENERKKLCQEIKLEYSNIHENILEFRHIPTGLIVGGYLANIALFEIDKIIDQNLNSNKSIAHFRFVDDHIFLSNNFNALLQWIDDYTTLLEKSNLGTTIHPEKTEPKELSIYLQKRTEETSTKELESLKKSASKSCKIDPNFPSPLLTQSLTKISEIAHIEFDLLNSDEEDEYLNELERLLLTELPHHELRPDTRVAFAASRIAYNAGKKGFFSEELYDITKKETLKVKKKRDLELLVKVYSEDQKRFPKKSDVRYKEIYHKKLDCNYGISNLEKELKEIRKRKVLIEHKVKEERDKHIHKIFEILLKAIQEYPDKIRVWSKTIEFIYESGVRDGIGRLFYLIDKLKRQQKLQIFASLFLKAFVLQVISEMVFKSIRRISNPNISDHEKEFSMVFLKSVLNARLFKSISSFYKIYNYNFIKTKVQVFYYAINVLKAVIGHFHAENSVSKLDIKTLYIRISYVSFPILNSMDALKKLSNNHLPQDWYWFGIRKTTLHDNWYPSPLYVEGVKLISSNKLELDRLLLLFPNHIPSSLIDQILKEARFGKIRENQGFIFELCRLNMEYLTNNNLLEIIPKNVANSIYNKTSLYQWTNYLETLQPQDPFDIRLSEWFSLMLVQLIAKSLMNIDSELASSRVFLHPANVILPQEFFEDVNFKGKSWNECKEKILLSKIRFVGNGIEDDIKLFQPSDNKNFQKFFEARAFGIMLLCLCTRTFDLPRIWNIPVLSEVYENRILIRLSHNPFSSWTTAIIHACLSARAKESFWQIIWNVINKEDDDDTIFEQLQIRSIDELISQIDNSLEVLENHQISVFNHEPRQLIPIYLEQLNKKDFSKLKSITV